MVNEEKYTEKQKQYQKWLSDIAFGKLKPIAFDNRKPKIETNAQLKFNGNKVVVNPEKPKPKYEKEIKNSYGQIKLQHNAISGINIKDYYETLNRIMRYQKVVKHARTQELIKTATVHNKPNPNKKTPHLKRFASVPYHRQINAITISKSCVQKHEKTLPTDYAKLNFKFQLIRRIPTKQYKTIWFSKGKRRK
ncbi:MAG: hypothetical protein DRJ03_06490 [Chloroflexi bacterium]|nr:MAG: hypothetical protein DRJ03_06490 [Chloroflexota bacterium]